MKFSTTLCILASLLVGCSSVCSPLYGREPCSFLPAPPGKTPPCARPGLTYCEHPDHYPGELIHHLIEKWRFDHGSIFTDESKEEFASYFYPSPKYGPPTTTNTINYGDSYFPEPIHIPKPQYPFSYQQPGNTYIPPSLKPPQNFSGGFSGYRNQGFQNPVQGQFYSYKYQQSFPVQRPEYQPVNYYSQIGQPEITQYGNEVWKRQVEEKFKRFKRTLKFKRSLSDMHLGLTGNSTESLRIKRQNAEGETLCNTRSQFIMPRAALNNKGNWMYVVNMPEVDQRFSQLVKSETCVSQVCSGICNLPQGYSSRCEQKYVQKRLVALEGGGNQLYTDVFWFPSCCVCTISKS